MLEDLLGSQIQARKACTRNNLYTENGVTAKLKEVVMDAHLSHTCKHLRPDRDQSRFDAGTRTDKIRGVGNLLCFRQREGIQI